MARTLAVALAVLILLVVASVPALAGSPILRLTQVCPLSPSATTCFITAAAPGGPIGYLARGTIRYYGPVMHPYQPLNRKVTLAAPDGSSIGGSFRWSGRSGSYVLGGGSGVLYGLHSNGTISLTGCLDQSWSYVSCGSPSADYSVYRLAGNFHW